jgi:hypothetical protein
MSELEQLRRQVATLQARLETTKDRSLVTLIQNWSGTTKSYPLPGFINSVETTAELGNWSDKDKIRIMTLKLYRRGKSLFDATPTLHDKDVTWKDFKVTLVNRFKDTRSDQFHFVELQSAKQQLGESINEFDVRVNNVGRNIIPQLDDPNAQKHVNILANKMLIAVFTTGLRGSPGEHARIALPTKMEDAINLTVEQAKTSTKQTDTGGKRDEMFLVGNKTRKTPRPKSTLETRCTHRDRSKGRDPENAREKWEDTEMTCYE